MQKAVSGSQDTLLPCGTAWPDVLMSSLGFKRRATAVLDSNLFLEFSSRQQQQEVFDIQGCTNKCFNQKHCDSYSALQSEFQPSLSCTTRGKGKTGLKFRLGRIIREMDQLLFQNSVKLLVQLPTKQFFFNPQLQRFDVLNVANRAIMTFCHLKFA